MLEPSHNDELPAIPGKRYFTIGEVSELCAVKPHVLRYWETRFPQLKPLQRAGNRRYYRPEDVALAKRIDRLLNKEGYTVKGVQQLLAREGGREEAPPERASADLLTQVRIVRDRLAAALADD